MVAGAKLRRMQGELVAFRPYAQSLQTITERFLKNHPGLTHPFLEQELKGSDSMEADSPLLAPLGLVLVSSDTGLCGTYNERILSLGTRFLMENPNASVVVIGKKGIRAFSRKGILSSKTIGDWGGRFQYSKVIELVSWMETLFREGKVSGWWVAYTKFISALKFEPTVEQFLPMGRSEASEYPEKIIVEPDPEKLAEELLSRYLKARFSRVLLEAFTSEHSARMSAMKNATDNASEMIEHLTLVRNKVRQAAITKELLEVVGGAEALK